MDTNKKLQEVTWADIQALGKLPYDHRLIYGEHVLQFGELRLPKGDKPFPIIVFIHGGCWLSAFSLDHVSAVCADLVKEGYACWTPEYRRVGDEGGGWPNTFLDIHKSVNFLNEIAEDFSLDLSRIVLMGHSAGGHLALWMAAQNNISPSSEIYVPDSLSITGVISLAGITDLVTYDEVGNSCSSSVTSLMGGIQTDFPDRYIDGNPMQLTPLGIPSRMVHGDLDSIVPLDQSQRFENIAKDTGDNTALFEVKGAGHFDMAHPKSEAWTVAKRELKALLE